MYPDKGFTIKSEKEVLAEIGNAASFFPGVRKVFLADGNAMVLSFRRLRNILTTLNKFLPELTRVSAYALPQDILRKKPEELKELRQMGLKLIYVGIESGDNEVLKLVNKGETFASTVEGLLKAKEAGIKLSVMILTGLGGKIYSRQHALNSARIVNQIQPDYLSILVLMFPHGLNHYKKRFHGNYLPLTLEDILEEMEIFIKNTALKRTIFRSDHASNYLTLKGVLSRDKKEFLEKLRKAQQDPKRTDLRPEWLRGL
jgi:radical SAM superfamily enzyme YgiQ (UPF0313 family)